MDFNKFVNGLRALGLPNEHAVYLAYAVKFGGDNPDMQEYVGTYGMGNLRTAIAAVEARAEV